VILRAFAAAALAVATLSVADITPAAADEPTVTLTIKDHKFDPAEVEIPANTKVKLIVKNADSTPEEFESHDFHREKVIPGGQQAIIFVGPLKPGRYEFFGEFNPKSARGHLVAK
jgi:hypothetical protein